MGVIIEFIEAKLDSAISKEVPATLRGFRKMNFESNKVIN
jgi:hypothetical protein